MAAPFGFNDEVYNTIYPGWGRREAEADWKEQGNNKWGGYVASQQSSPQSAANTSIETAFNNLNQEVAKRFKQYNQASPFKIDDVLKAKRAEAGEQIDPYYNETLSNYLMGVERKLTRGAQDTADLLSELSGQTTAYSENAQFKLSEAINRAGEGYAGVGLFESGARYRTEGLLERDTSSQIQDFLRRQEFKEDIARTGLERTQQDIGLGSLTGGNLTPQGIAALRTGGGFSNIPGLGLETSQELRNVERQRFTETEERSNQLLREQGQKYITGFQSTLPPEYQQTDPFSLLKSIGVYS